MYALTASISLGVLVDLPYPALLELVLKLKLYPKATLQGRNHHLS